MCNAGFAGPSDGTCTACIEGKFSELPMDELMSRHPPYISSRAADWDGTTFTTECGGQTCRGSQGTNPSGTVIQGQDSNAHGKVGTVDYLQGDTATQMQWGTNSIPSTFTICSLTRYSGATQGRILSCHGNPKGNKNWLHGHLNGRGPIYYNRVMSWDTAVGPVDNWLVACGRNTATAGAISTLVEGVPTSTAKGGDGSCAEIGRAHV